MATGTSADCLYDATSDSLDAGGARVDIDWPEGSTDFFLNVGRIMADLAGLGLGFMLTHTGMGWVDIEAHEPDDRRVRDGTWYVRVTLVD